MTPFLGVALHAGCNCDVRIGNYGVEKLVATFCFITSNVLAAE